MRDKKPILFIVNWPRKRNIFEAYSFQQGVKEKLILICFRNHFIFFNIFLRSIFEKNFEKFFNYHISSN